MIVVAMVERDLIYDVRRSDEGIFVCVPSPTNEALGKDRKAARNLSSDRGILDEGPNNWTTVVRRHSKQSGKRVLATGGPVGWKEPKARCNLE